MTWKDYNIANYMAGQKRIKMVNESRKQAQKLLILESKRTNPGAPVVKLNRHGKHK
jgi:hypothetical protein